MVGVVVVVGAVVVVGVVVVVVGGTVVVVVGGTVVVVVGGSRGGRARRGRRRWVDDRERGRVRRHPGCTDHSDDERVRARRPARVCPRR